MEKVNQTTFDFSGCNISDKHNSTINPIAQSVMTMPAVMNGAAAPGSVPPPLLPSFRVPLIKMGPDGKPILAGTVSSNLCNTDSSIPNWKHVVANNPQLIKGLSQFTPLPVQPAFSFPSFSKQPLLPNATILPATLNPKNITKKTSNTSKLQSKTSADKSSSAECELITTISNDKKKKPLKRRIKLKSPFLSTLASDISSVKVLGRSAMNAQQLSISLDRVTSLISRIEELSSDDSSTNNSFTSVLCKLRRLRHKFLRMLSQSGQSGRKFDVDSWISTHIKDGTVTPLIDIVLPKDLKVISVNSDTSAGDVVFSAEPLNYHDTIGRKIHGDASLIHIVDQSPTLSPFTGKMLSQFLWRDYDTQTSLMKTFAEIRRRNVEPFEFPKSIDYAYLRPHHVSQTNAMLSRLFWPDIDITPELKHPDFCIVVLYGRRVVGCGMMETGHTHNYITYIAVDYGFRGAGIASRLLYMLSSIQKKDITLHVQPTNSLAMMLYQRWGFKMEKYLVGFYDRYVPWKSGEGPGEWSTRGSRNAMFMRLRQ